MFDEVEKKINNIEFKLRTLEENQALAAENQRNFENKWWRITAVSFPALYIVVETIMYLKGSM